MENIKSLILTLVIFFTFSIGMNAQGYAIPYEQIGWVRLDNKSINSSYNDLWSCYDNKCS